VIFSTSCFGRVILAVFLILLISLRWAKGGEPVQEQFDGEQKRPLIAVLPFENLSGESAPLRHYREALITHMEGQGVRLLDEQDLTRFVRKHRVRYTGGIDRSIAKAIREETGSDAVLLSSLELFDPRNPPQMALFSRLVSTGEAPAILWMDGVGLAGDDSPGILDLGLIRDHERLLDKALLHLSRSLGQYLAGTQDGMNRGGGVKKFKPKLSYRSPVFDPSARYHMAVVPFFNESSRRHGETVMALHVVNWLVKTAHFSVAEPGVVRDTLLRLRIIMDDGLSLAQADLLFDRLDVDMIFTSI
jgi:hypothetical protein